MTPDFHAHAKQRLISNAHPGWRVRTYKPGTSEEEWLKVISAFNFNPESPTERPRTVLMCLVDEETREAAQIVDYSNEYVLCCTKAEAKKAGVV